MTRKHLWMPELLGKIRDQFKKIKDPIKRATESTIPLTDCLMSGIAVFQLKYPSLLQFDEDARNDEVIKSNLRTLFQIQKAPSDTYMRERLDIVNPEYLQRGINTVITQLQRAKVLEDYIHFNDTYLVPIDGTGYFSSHDIHCEHCCEKHHKDGTITYHHNALSCVITHPAYKPVFPLAVEPIIKQDGIAKNDCEINAGKRLITKIRTAHPHFKITVLLDNLYTNGPFIKELKTANMHFIITATATGNPHLFDAYKHSKPTEVTRIRDGVQEVYKFTHNLPINDTHHDELVNFVEYSETKNGKIIYRSSWITDHKLTKENIFSFVQAARCRWHIENETFNTLKNQGYHFEHNFGHGNTHLSTVMMMLMFIAFAVDQVQEATSKYFQQALQKTKRKMYLWKKLTSIFLNFLIDSWETLYRVIFEPKNPYAARSMLLSP